MLLLFTHTHTHIPLSLLLSLTHSCAHLSLSLLLFSLSSQRATHRGRPEYRRTAGPAGGRHPHSPSLSHLLSLLLFSFSSHRLWAQSLGTQGSSRAYTCLSSWTRVVPDGSNRDFGYSHHGRRQAELLFAPNPKPLPSTC